jgi:hypothetical protein
MSNDAMGRSNSVFDFLYCDARRVGSFLAQLNPAGNPTGKRTTKSSQQISGDNTALGFDIKIVKGSAGTDLSMQSGQQSEETYDPFWTGAVTLLDQLKIREILQSDMHKAGIGQLVLLSGTIKILDLRVLKAIWDIPSLKAKFGIGDSSKMSPEQAAENELTLEFIKVMPHTVQAEFYCSETSGSPFSASWMMLDPEAMVVPPGDVLMKYGHHVPGIWNILAIKDAPVDNGPILNEELMQQAAETNWGEVATKRHSTALALIAEFLAPAARRAMGRPGAYYGVTPIMIFRQVSGNSNFTPVL